MFSGAGRKLKLSMPRQMVADFLHFSQKVPTVTIGRRMRIEEVMTAQAQRPSSAQLEHSACQGMGDGRALANPSCVGTIYPFPGRTFMSTPPMWRPSPSPAPGTTNPAYSWPRFRSLKRNRCWNSIRPCVNIASSPSKASPPSIGRYASRRLPRLVRRPLQWLGFNASGALRAFHVGTFGVTTLNMEETDSLRPLSLWTTMLHFGVPQSNGEFYIRLTFDHRVLDGAITAWALHELERTLKTEITAELLALRGERPGARANFTFREKEGFGGGYSFGRTSMQAFPSFVFYFAPRRRMNRPMNFSVISNSYGEGASSSTLWPFSVGPGFARK